MKYFRIIVFVFTVLIQTAGSQSIAYYVDATGGNDTNTRLV